MSQEPGFLFDRTANWSPSLQAADFEPLPMLTKGASDEQNLLPLSVKQMITQPNVVPSSSAGQEASRVMLGMELFGARQTNTHQEECEHSDGRSSAHRRSVEPIAPREQYEGHKPDQKNRGDLKFQGVALPELPASP